MSSSFAGWDRLLMGDIRRRDLLFEVFFGARLGGDCGRNWEDGSVRGFVDHYCRRFDIDISGAAPTP